MDIALTVLSYFGIAQALILAVIYFVGYGKHKQNRGLGSLFLLFTAAMIIIILTNTLETGLHDFPIHIEYLLTFCAGPVLFIVVHDLRRDPSYTPALTGLHFAPAITYTGVAMWVAFSGSSLSISILIPLIHMQAYSAWLIITMWRDRHSEKNPYKIAGHGWLKLLSILLVCLHTAQWIRIAFPNAGYIEYLIPVTAFALMYGLMIYGFVNPSLFTTNGNSAYRFGKAGFRRQLHLLEEKMSQYELYKNQGLTLDVLAAEVEIPSHEISHIINKGLNKNFNEWINQYRVNLVKEMLNDSSNQHLTIDALAEEAGFNSRSSFYDAFNKLTGTTPTKYKKNN